MDTNSNSNPQTPPSQAPNTPSSGHNNIAILAYLGPLILIPWLSDAKNDPFVKFHIKQGLLVLIPEVIIWLLGSAFWHFWMIINLVNILTFVLSVIGIMNVIKGEQKELPIIGHWSSNFHF